MLFGTFLIPHPNHVLESLLNGFWLFDSLLPFARHLKLGIGRQPFFKQACFLLLLTIYIH